MENLLNWKKRERNENGSLKLNMKFVDMWKTITPLRVCAHIYIYIHFSFVLLTLHFRLLFSFQWAMYKRIWACEDSFDACDDDDSDDDAFARSSEKNDHQIVNSEIFFVLVYLNLWGKYEINHMHMLYNIGKLATIILYTLKIKYLACFLGAKRLVGWTRALHYRAVDPLQKFVLCSEKENMVVL